MAGYLILIALCVVGANAIPKPAAQSNAHKGRVGGDPPLDPFANAPHACMVLVFRSGLEPGMAALGGGSIISTRHVVTAAHLVQGSNTKYQVGFFPTPTTRRIFESTFRVIHEDYDNTDFSSDIALIFLQGTNTFPTANVIPISTDAAPPAAGSALTTVGFGFTAADSTGASSDPYAAVQLPATPCDLEGIVEADTHFCAVDDTSATWVCPGDNGAGCFSGTTPAENTLVGIASRILPGCSESKHTGYTIVGLFAEWISNIAGIPVATFIENYNKANNKK
jgi:secreted trypsin-like serine protease